MITRSACPLSCRTFILAFLACGPGVLAALTQAQTATVAATPDKPLSYEVVSIKPDKENVGVRTFWRSSNNGFLASMTLEDLLMNAYDLNTPDQISGLPSWASSDQFAVEAKMDEDTMAALKKLPREEAARQQSAMLQAVLADRFQLKAYVRTRDLPVYALVIAKGGLKLKETPAGSPGGYSVGPGELKGHKIKMESLAFSLTGTAGRIVVDKTGLTGGYDVDLKWTEDGAQNSTNDAPDLFTALQEQLGLKLESSKAPVKSVVVDHVEKPSEN